MIYFVDEDVGQLRPWAIELRMRGFGVEMLRNADVAWERLLNTTDVELVLIDIMLAAQENDQSRYSRAATDNYLETGLVFLDELVQQRPQYFPARAAILTMTGLPRLLQKAQLACQKYNIPLLRKFEFATPLEFGDEIEGILDSKGLRG